jgi:hypothetical protein
MTESEENTDVVEAKKKLFTNLNLAGSIPRGLPRKGVQGLPWGSYPVIRRFGVS